jgi:hypothetical protein
VYPGHVQFFLDGGLLGTLDLQLARAYCIQTHIHPSKKLSRKECMYGMNYGIKCISL